MVDSDLPLACTRRYTYCWRTVGSCAAVYISNHMKKAVRFLNDIFIKIFLGFFYIIAIGPSFILRMAFAKRRAIGDSYWETNDKKEEWTSDYFNSPY